MKTSCKKSMLMIIFLCLMLFMVGCSKNAGSSFVSTSGKSSNWAYAKELQAEGRYEIAKEYMLLALSQAQTMDEQNWIERELFALDLQIKTRR